jgi:hypothetical protein
MKMPEVLNLADVKATLTFSIYIDSTETPYTDDEAAELLLEIMAGQRDKDLLHLIEVDREWNQEE